LDEVGRNADSGEVLVTIAEEFFRPAEVNLLLSDPTRARDELDWRPKLSFEQLVERMVAADLDRWKERR